MSAPAVMKLHVEGWRRINHSYALVNRNHLRWLLKDPRLSITHREMPYFKAHWAANPNHSFPEAFEAVLNLPDQDAPPDVDVTLRMDFPHRFDKPARGKLVVFGTTEYTHISPENLRGDVAAAASDPEVFILTPSQWSAQGFLKLGFPQERVWVLPHGVDKEHFRITTPEEKARYRALLGIDQTAKVFLHVGGGWFGKGLDLLIEAFSIHAKTHPRSRLVIKGHDALYGNAVLNAFANRPLSLPPGVELSREQILYLGGDLSDESMDHLYRLADCYVATYRGEGFNMPLLEAAARGLEVIATAGGASDDFLPMFSKAQHLRAELKRLPDKSHYLEVNRRDLVGALEGKAPLLHTDAFLAQRQLTTLAEKFSWHAVGHALSDMLVGAARHRSLLVAPYKHLANQSDPLPNTVNPNPHQRRSGPPIHVAFCTDQTYIPQLAAAVVSLFISNAKEQLAVHLVSDAFTAEVKSRFDAIALRYGREIHYIELSALQFEGLVEYYQPKSAYYRLVLPMLLPHLSRVIYLDCDLVVEANLRELWDTDLGGNPVGAVAEREPLQAGLQAHIGLPGDPYVNSGVLVFNLEQWRQEKLADRCFEWIRAHPQQATMMDQDSINVVCHRRKRFIDLKWNLNPIHGPPHKTLPNFPERILHFAGPIKPWHRWYSFDLIKIFYNYLDQTPWKGEVLLTEPTMLGQFVSTGIQERIEGDELKASSYFASSLEGIKGNYPSLPSWVWDIFETVRTLWSKGQYSEGNKLYLTAVGLIGFPANHGDIYQIPHLR